ncbi:MAG: hypothetical protein WAL50_17960 [Kineosporiaceae bacterium]
MGRARAGPDGLPDDTVRAFVDDARHLAVVVRDGLPRLGDLRGPDAVHLACHLGTDTVSPAGLGARICGPRLSSGAAALTPWRGP